MRPDGSAIMPRMPANCEIALKPPFVAPEFAMMAKLPCSSILLRTASPTLTVVSCQISITRSFCSCSVSKPRRKSPCTSSTLCKATPMISLFSGGMVISEIAMVTPERVANLKPISLMRSAISTTTSSSINSSMEAIISLMPPLSITSFTNWNSGMRTRLNRTRPTVVLINRFSGSDSRSPSSLKIVSTFT